MELSRGHGTQSHRNSFFFFCQRQLENEWTPQDEFNFFECSSAPSNRKLHYEAMIFSLFPNEQMRIKTFVLKLLEWESFWTSAWRWLQQQRHSATDSFRGLVQTALLHSLRTDLLLCTSFATQASRSSVQPQVGILTFPAMRMWRLSNSCSSIKCFNLVQYMSRFE